MEALTPEHVSRLPVDLAAGELPQAQSEDQLDTRGEEEQIRGGREQP
jgi:hypothetical protein